MEKYIRTKDGIYIVEDENELYIYCRNGFNRKMFALQKNNLTSGCDYIGEYKIVSTINELCDEVVIVKTNNPKLTKPFVVDKYNTDFIKECNKRGYIIKGAIWTDEGLKYVIKMNEEGDWELI